MTSCFEHPATLREYSPLTRSVGKPDSVAHDHFSGTVVTNRLKQPTRIGIGTRIQRADLARTTQNVRHLFGLAPRRVFLISLQQLPATTTAADRRPVHPFCGTIRRLAALGGYPIRRPMESGLSSPPKLATASEGGAIM